MHISLDQAKQFIHQNFSRPAHGRCFIALDRLPSTIGSLHVPDSARDLKISNTMMSGTVLAVTPTRKEIARGDGPGFTAGDCVLLLLRDEDRDKEVIVTRNEVVCAVLENIQLRVGPGI